eukprot:6451260-Prymnesium_polylepis.1
MRPFQAVSGSLISKLISLAKNSIRPLIVTYLVPEAPQGRVTSEYRLTAHHRPWAISKPC